MSGFTGVAPVYLVADEDTLDLYYLQKDDPEEWHGVLLDTWDHGVWYEGRLVGIAPHPDLARAMLRVIKMNPELLEFEDADSN